MTRTVEMANRWGIALAGTALQLCLGTVYAWSYFQQPLVDAYGWSNAQVAWAFSLAICCLGLTAAVGGTQLTRFGPRTLAVLGGLLFGLGYLVASVALASHTLWLLYVGYGVVGGSGLGLGYVTPVATVARWFPDKKGLVTGMVIMGFGFGALLMSKVIAPVLMEYSGGNMVTVFLALGVGLGVATVAIGLTLRMPPSGYVPPGHQPSPNLATTEARSEAPAEERSDARQAILSWRFLAMWLVFFANIVAGISLISFQSPIFQDLWHKVLPTIASPQLAAYGATLIAVSSLFNGVGRMFWGGVSDRIGRAWTFRLMLLTQAAAFGLLSLASDPERWAGLAGLSVEKFPWVFAGLVCYILLCYGGGFGTMPSFVLDVFGSRRMAVVYGTILTAWSAAGVAGPQLVAFLKDHYGPDASRYAFLASAVLVAAGFVLALALRDRRTT